MPVYVFGEEALSSPINFYSIFANNVIQLWSSAMYLDVIVDECLNWLDQVRCVHSSSLVALLLFNKLVCIYQLIHCIILLFYIPHLTYS